MKNKNTTVNKDYWEKNIEGFSGFYDKNSEENIIAPGMLALLYKKILFPIEKKFMHDRYNIVTGFIEKNVHAGMTVADIGCGSGIFVNQMVARGAKVFAIDYTKSAIELVKAALSKDELKSVELLQLDVTKEHIPAVDIAISIGVLTYIDEINRYFDNILPYTDKLLFNYLDSRNPLNILRKVVPILDVRRLTYFTSDSVKDHLEKKNFKIAKIQKLATGYVVESEKK